LLLGQFGNRPLQIAHLEARNLLFRHQTRTAFLQFNTGSLASFAANAADMLIVQNGE